MAYKSFRIQISPNVTQPGSWSVEVLKCPIPEFDGERGTVLPVFTRAELNQLRNPAVWPDDALLKSIGENVWRSLMPDTVRNAFIACRKFTNQMGDGMRMIVVVNGNDANGGGAAQVRLSELPVEAVFAQSFIARDVNTPVSRSLAVSTTYAPAKVLLPFRILVVVATPVDMPVAQVDEEKKIIEKALKPLVDTNTLKVDFCLNATKKRLLQMLTESYHVVHFICHGAFEPAGEDATPVPYLCLESEDTQESDPLVADILRNAVVGSGTRLVMFTSCASSQAAPAQEPYEHRAFDGMAQSLVGGLGGVPAVVAMQFDFESKAALAFSETFYHWFLRPDVSLDLAVTRAREAVAASRGGGHRAWVTPTVYWNCEGVPLFDFAHLRSASLDPATQQEVFGLEVKIETMRSAIGMMGDRTAVEQAALMPLRDLYLKEIHRLEEQRGLKLGDSLRLRGDSAPAGGTVVLRLEMRLRLAATIGFTQLKLQFPLDRLTFQAATKGADTNAVPAIASNGGELTVILADVSQGQNWGPGKYEIGVLRFAVAADAKSFVDVKLRDAIVARDGAAAAPFVMCDPVIFVS